MNTYNQQIPQRALNHLSPIQALKEWQKKKPELFKKRIYNQAGLDTYSSQGSRIPLKFAGFGGLVRMDFFA